MQFVCTSVYYRPQRISYQPQIWNFQGRLKTRERTEREARKNFIGEKEGTLLLQTGRLMTDPDRRHCSYRAVCSRSLRILQSFEHPSDVPTRRALTMLLLDDPCLPCQASDPGVHNPTFDSLKGVLQYYLINWIFAY